MRPDLITIDGSLGEGGGQILRTSLALSCITGTPFEIRNIRANRDKPGLRPQHLQCVNAAGQIADARVTGAEIGSTHVTFAPNAIRPGDYSFDIGTAGAASLVFQTVVYPLALAASPSSLAVSGGTHVPFAPCFHYLALQWLPFMAQLGFRISLKMRRAGYYPEGGGRISAHIQPRSAQSPLCIEAPGPVQRVSVLSASSNLPSHVAERQAHRAEKLLTQHRLPMHVTTEDLPARGKGSVLCLTATCRDSQACYAALGARGKRAERVADEACTELTRFLETGAAVDRFLADQLLIPLALGPGRSTVVTESVTQHLLTNA